MDSNRDSNIANNSYRELYSNYLWYRCNEDTNPEEYWELRNSGFPTCDDLREGV